MFCHTLVILKTLIHLFDESLTSIFRPMSFYVKFHTSLLFFLSIWADYECIIRIFEHYEAIFWTRNGSDHKYLLEENKTWEDKPHTWKKLAAVTNDPAPIIYRLSRAIGTADRVLSSIITFHQDLLTSPPTYHILTTPSCCCCLYSKYCLG